LEKLSLADNFWDDIQSAQKIMKEKSDLSDTLEEYMNFVKQYNSIKELYELAELENDQELLDQLSKEILELSQSMASKEIECLFHGEHDKNDCFLEINAGAGGTESHDWAEMLLRMYTRWADIHKFKTEIVDILDGEEAGIKSVCIKITGKYAYGWCKYESGVHRLVRNSPFNASGKRQTSFASIWTYPVVDDNINIEILDKELKIDTYRASGAGGQHVNKTESAVRVTHIPSGIVVQCQTDRSQHRNKAECMSMLKSRLFEAELKKRQAVTDAVNDTKTDIGWGHQIRSYVLQPYQMIKDLRTDYETSDSRRVLDGEIDGFMISNLKANVSKG
jgi:peptide chain release factor 2